MNTLIYMLSAVFCGGFALRSWNGDSHDPVRRSFMLVGACTSLCYVGFTLYLVPGLTAFRYLHAIAGAFLPVSLLWFFDRLLGKGAYSATTWRLTVTTPFATVVFLTVDIAFYGNSHGVTLPEILLALYVYGGFGLCLWRLWRAHEQSTVRVVRARIRYLLSLLGAAVGFSGFEALSRLASHTVDISQLSLVERSVVLQGALPPVGAIFTTLFIYFLYQVLILYRLLDLHEIFARISALVIAGLLLVLVDGVTVIWVGNLSSYPVHGTFQIFLASVLFLSFYDPLRERIEALASEVFNRRGRMLEVTLNEIDRAMAKVISLDGLERELLGRLQASGRCPLATVYLWDDKRQMYRLTLQSGRPDDMLIHTIAPAPFTDGFKAGAVAYIRGDLEQMVTRRDPRHEEATARIRILDAMSADVTIPAMSGEVVLGWLNIQDEHWSDGFSQDEVRRLVGTVDRAAILLENIYSVEKLKEQHRLAALGTMAAGLAHEIRNPLAGIKGAAQYLQGDTEPAEVADFVTVIIEEADRLNIVVSHFLDYARPFKLDTEPTVADNLVRHVLDLVRAESLPEEVQLIHERAPEAPMVSVDRHKIRQVLLNLVHNALHAIGDIGTITITIRSAKTTRPMRRGAPCLEISVTDTGSGITTEDMEKLFIPFFTTKSYGTGLGLAISRRLVEAHGGEIHVRSRPRLGSTFSILLPIIQTETSDDSRSNTDVDRLHEDDPTVELALRSGDE
ncbi:MAG: ATP-binding protein [Myxococcota bacterium]|nr:ATP-binding protein [Myxococcota bacterium]